MSDLEELSAVEQAAAEAVWAARRNLRPIAPVRETFGVSDQQSAYRIQEANTRRWLAQGRRTAGRKIGLTSKAVQQQLGVGEPDFGMLWQDLAFQHGDAVPLSLFMQPRIESEIAFVLKRRLADPATTMTALMSAVDYCLPAIEIVDSAIERWNISLADTIADNASSGGFVLGGSPRSLKEADLRLCGMIMSRGAEILSYGLGAACLGHPLNAALWLARKMAAVERPLEAGDVILSGALGPMVGVTEPQRVLVEIQGFEPLEVGFA